MKKIKKIRERVKLERATFRAEKEGEKGIDSKGTIGRFGLTIDLRKLERFPSHFALRYLQ